MNLNDQMAATSVTSLFETTKEQRLSFVESLMSNLTSGTIDPKKLHLQVKGMEEIVKLILDNKEYKGILLDDATKYGNSFSYLNAEWNVKETGVSYDYSACNDPILTNIQQQIAELELRLKDRQTFLKSVSRDGATLVDEETGEVFHVKPPIKKSTTSVTVKLK